MPRHLFPSYVPVAKPATRHTIAPSGLPTRTVLIVDQDDAWRQAVSAVLKAEYRVLRAASGETALAMLMREDVDAMLLNVEQPGISGFETLRIGRENFELTEVVMTASSPDLEHAVEAVKLGAFHFVPKTGGADAVRALIGRALERQALARQVQVLSAEASDTTEREFVVGRSRNVQSVVDLGQPYREALGHGAHSGRERHR